MFAFLKFSLFSQPYFSISEVFCCHSTIIQSEILYFILYRFTVEHNLSFWKKKNFLVQEKVKKTTAWSKKRKKKGKRMSEQKKIRCAQRAWLHHTVHRHDLLALWAPCLLWRSDLFYFPGSLRRPNCHVSKACMFSTLLLFSCGFECELRPAQACKQTRISWVQHFD